MIILKQILLKIQNQKKKKNPYQKSQVVVPFLFYHTKGKDTLVVFHQLTLFMLDVIFP